MIKPRSRKPLEHIARAEMLLKNNPIIMEPILIKEKRPSSEAFRKLLEGNVFKVKEHETPQTLTWDGRERKVTEMHSADSGRIIFIRTPQHGRFPSMEGKYYRVLTWDPTRSKYVLRRGEALVKKTADSSFYVHSIALDLGREKREQP